MTNLLIPNKISSFKSACNVPRLPIPDLHIITIVPHFLTQSMRSHIKSMSFWQLFLGQFRCLFPHYTVENSVSVFFGNVRKLSDIF